MANVIFARTPKLMNTSSTIANSRKRFAQSSPRRWTWKSWVLYPLFFTPLALMSKGSVQTCRRLKTSHIVIPFFGTRFTIMPLGIFGRPDVRPNSSRKSPAPSKLLLLRSLILDERQLIKFPISIIGIDGGQLGPSLTFWQIVHPLWWGVVQINALWERTFPYTQKGSFLRE